MRVDASAATRYDVDQRMVHPWKSTGATLALAMLVAASGACTSGPGSARADADADVATDGSPGDADEADGSDGAPDAEPVTCAEMSAGCASDFGSLFTPGNGRADGTLVALVEPTDTQCTLFNDDHVVLQLSMEGQVQRLVVSVDGVAVYRTTAQLLGPAYSEGWHTGLELDYVRHLEVHSGDFTPVTMEEAVAFVCSEVEIGAPLSVFAYSDGEYPSSAHQVHRNDRYPDGAIAVHPTSATPTYLLFRYLDQVF